MARAKTTNPTAPKPDTVPEGAVHDHRVSAQGDQVEIERGGAVYIRSVHANGLVVERRVR